MTRLYAQPYDISATGFFFETEEEYNQKAASLLNCYGQPVEEFEIQFIDGDNIDAKLFEALSINQCTYGGFLDVANSWSNDDKIKVIIAVGEVGYKFDLQTDSPDQLNVDLYEVDSLKKLAEQFVEEGLFGEIPERIQHYLDFDAIARDLGMDYVKITIGETQYIYRCD